MFVRCEIIKIYVKIIPGFLDNFWLIWGMKAIKASMSVAIAPILLAKS